MGPNGEYAYFLTASHPFLPPCLRHRPGTLRGFEEKGSACKEGSAQSALGCPDHIWYHGTTRDSSMVAGRRLCGGSGACGGTVTIDGFLADKKCWDMGIASDGANMTHEPWKHTVACMMMPVCEQSGFVILKKMRCDNVCTEQSPRCSG